MKLHWLRIGASQPLAGPHGLLVWAYARLVAVGTPDFLLVAGKAFTIWSNLMTIFGSGVNAPARVSATDPTFLMGANGTDPAKIAINAQGRALLTATTATAQREAAIAEPNKYAALSYTEHFLGITSLVGGMGTTTASGGTITAIPTDGRVGVMRVSPGATASNNGRGHLGTGISDNCISTSSLPLLFVAVCAPAVALFTVPISGRINVGFADTDGTGLPVDGVYFYSNNGGAWQCVARANNIETPIFTSLVPALGDWHTFAIRLTDTLAEFWIDGVLQASISTNVPSGPGRLTGYGIRTQKTSANVLEGAIDVDLVRVVIPCAVAPI